MIKRLILCVAALLLAGNAQALGFITVSGGYANAGNGSTGGSGGGTSGGGGGSTSTTIAKGYVDQNGSTSTGTSVSTHAGTTAATGSTFIAEVSQRSVGAPTVTDNKGNTWVQAQTNGYGGNAASSLFYCINCTGGTGYIATATYASAPIASIIFTEFLNVGAASVDANPASFFNQADNKTISAPSVTTTVANELVVSAYGAYNNYDQTITNAGAGFAVTASQQVQAVGNNGAISWFVPANSGSPAFDTFNFVNNDYTIGFTLSIKPGAGGGGGGGGGGGTGGGTGTITTGVWTNVTPSNMDLNNDLGCGNFGVETVAVDPNNSGTFYAHADCQGIWKSTDYGATWTGPINTGINGSTIGNCAGGITLLPTGSTPTLVEACIRGATGFWASTNGGVDWTSYNIGPLPSNRQDVYWPSVDPYNAQHIVMTGHEQNYIVESFNGGQTWSNVSMASGMLEPGGTGFAFFINTGASNTTATTMIWTAQQSGGAYGTWRTTNDGASWTQVSTNEHPHGSMQIYQPGGGVVYMPGAYGSCGWGVQRSTDYGATWSCVGSGNNMTAIIGDSNTVYGMYGWAQGVGTCNNPTFQLAPQPGTGTWSQAGTPDGMCAGTAEMAIANNGTNNIIINGAWWDGVWRYVETVGSGTNPSPVNGVVGPANGVAVGQAPTTGLCTSGTATAVAGTGPWTWTCQGSNGGSSQNGSAPKAGNTGGTGRPSYNTGTGLFVLNGVLYDSNGNPFRIRGVNRQCPSCAGNPGMDNANANSVREFMADGVNTSSSVTNIADEISHSEVPILAPAYFPDGTTISGNTSDSELQSMVSWWVSHESSFAPYAKHLIINIANEWGPANSQDWANQNISAIAQLRAAGYLEPIMVDTGAYGTDLGDLVNYSQQVFNSDPQRNVIFTLHVYYNAVTDLQQNYFGQLANMQQQYGMVFSIQEFGPASEDNGSTPQAIIQAAEAAGLGWAPWAWNEGDQFDITNPSNNGIYTGSSSQLSDYGNIVVPYLKSLAVRATDFP